MSATTVDASATHTRFRLETLEDLRNELDRLGIDLPVEADDLSPLAQSVAFGAHTLPNRFAVHPMEGFDADAEGRPGPLAFRRYERYAAGGTGLIWFEATAVVPEARSNPGQFHISEATADIFARLVERTRRAAREAHGREPLLLVQLTHSGRYSKPTGAPAPIIAHRSPILDPKHDLPPDYPVITDDELDRLQERFVEAARLAARAGFDGVDVKACHRYLVSELLASHTREGRYGGSFENRTRFLRETLERIRDAVPELFVTTRMNAFDAIEHPYGFGVDREDAGTPDLTEPLRLADELKAIGVPLLNVSIGNPYFNPHYGRPYDFPIAGFTPPDDHPLAGVARIVQVTRAFQERLGEEVPVVGTGYSWLRHLMPHVAAGIVHAGWAGLVGLGRSSFAYPEAPGVILETGRMDPAKCCVTCSACTQIMRDGGRTGCVVHDSEVYGPEYREGRRFALDRLQEEARRCRDCLVPSCRAGCPARVDVPAFVKAFAESDFRAAYDILRANNVLPEMCGHICPSEEQCEGGCVESVFCERPIPIRDIQLVTCRIARLEGWVGARIPTEPSGRHVAVVGGGPAGIACAVRLLEAGHHVTLMDRAPALGGTPDQGIPQTRYGNAAAEVEAILAPALAARRIELRLGESLGTEATLESLRAAHDAVCLAPGLADSTSLGTADGVWQAGPFLRAAKAGELAEMPPRVAVLGGGNTAMDAALTAKTLGAQDVYLLYRRSFEELPAWSAERDHTLNAGVHFLILTQPAGYETDEAGRLTGVRIQRTRLGDPDASGRRRPEPLPGTENLLPVDLAVEAMGQGVPETLREALAGVRFTDRGLVATKEGRLETSLAGVWAGGDVVSGGTTAVQGVAEGMRAADAIDARLREAE